LPNYGIADASRRVLGFWKSLASRGFADRIGRPPHDPVSATLSGVSWATCGPPPWTQKVLICEWEILLAASDGPGLWPPVMDLAVSLGEFEDGIVVDSSSLCS
jgi:hypothetical protein